MAQNDFGMSFQKQTREGAVWTIPISNETLRALLYALLDRKKEVVMEMDIPLTYFFECPSCGFRGLFNAEPTAYVKCICGRWWVIGDYKYYKSLGHEEREKIRTWDVNLGSCGVSRKLWGQA